MGESTRDAIDCVEVHACGLAFTFLHPGNRTAGAAFGGVLLLAFAFSVLLVGGCRQKSAAPPRPATESDPVRGAQLRELVPPELLEVPLAVSGERVMEHLRQMVAVGPHRRTGTPEAYRAAEYIEGVLGEAGLETSFDPFPFEAFRFAEHSLTVDGVDGPIASFPVYYSGATPPEGIEADLVWVGGATQAEVEGAPLDGAIALAILPLEASGSEPAITGVPERLLEAGAVAAVFSADFWPGNVIAAINTEEYEEDMRLPSLLVGRRDAERLAEVARAAPTSARLVLDARLEPAEARNVIGLLPGSSDELVIVNSSYNGWFTAAVERLGSAIVLHLAEVFAARPVEARPKSLLFVLTSGHEVGNLGARRFMEESGAEFLDRAGLFLNIGSGQAGHTLAEVDGELEVLDTIDPRWGMCSRNELLLPIVHNALWAFDVPAPIVTTDRMNFGEGIWAARRGVPHLGIVGSGAYWHTAADTLDKTSPELAEPVARAWAIIVAFAATLPDGALRATEWRRQAPP